MVFIEKSIAERLENVKKEVVVVHSESLLVPPKAENGGSHGHAQKC